jgi:hypothetical protein
MAFKVKAAHYPVWTASQYDELLNTMMMLEVTGITVYRKRYFG